MAEPHAQQSEWATYALWLIAPVVTIALFANFSAIDLSASGFDFSVYWKAARAFAVDGGTLYAWAEPGFNPQQAEAPFLYPPPAVLLFLPLASLPLGIAYALWCAIELAAAGVALYVVGWKLLPVASPRRPMALAAALLVLAPHLAWDLYAGQVNALLLAMATLAVLALKRRRPVTAGLLIAVAAMVKVTPAVLVCLLVVPLNWRGLAGFAAGVGLTLAATTLALLPQGDAWQKNARLYEAYAGKVVFRHASTLDPAIAGGDLAGNLSLQSTAGRLAAGGGPAPVWARRAGLAIGVLMCAATLALLWRRRESAAWLPALLAAALANITCWFHHLLMLVALPFIVGAAGHLAGARKRLGLLLALHALLIVLPFGADIWDDRNWMGLGGAGQLVRWGGSTAALAALWGWLFVNAWRGK